MKNPITVITDFVDSNSVVRRLVLAFTLYLTYTCTIAAWAFAYSTTFAGLETAAVITAVLAPTLALQGFAFATYNKGRK